VKRFALLLLFATTALGAQKADLALMNFLPAIPKRTESGCWPARAIVLRLHKGKISGTLDAFNGDRRVYHGVAAAAAIAAEDEYSLTWPVPAACDTSATALRLRYRLTLRLRGARATVVRRSRYPGRRDHRVWSQRRETHR
jgi:hypothetical protein